MKALPSERLNEKIKLVWRISSLIGTVFWALAAFVMVRFAVVPVNTHLRWLFIPAIAILVWRVLSLAVFPRVRYARWRYEILDDEIDVMEGLLFITRTIIPMIRVQYTNTSQGPIMRAFGLSAVTIFTAGGNVEIPGLIPEDADALRDRIAALAKLAKEDT